MNKNTRILTNHPLHQPNRGENHGFDCCASYVMNSLGENDYDYDFFTGLTGDVFVPVFAQGDFYGDNLTDYSIGKENETSGAYLESIFNICGYASHFVPKAMVMSNRQQYIQLILEHIDRGIPVIEYGYNEDGPPWGVIVGYENNGEKLLVATMNGTEPSRISTKELSVHLMFVDSKYETKDSKQLYSYALTHLYQLLTAQDKEKSYGAKALYDWATNIESDKFTGINPEAFNGWLAHVCYVCNIATASYCSHRFLDKVKQLHPDFTFLEEIKKQYQRLGQIWNNDNGNDLEALGGGFNISLSTLQDKAKCRQIAAKIREAGDCIQRVTDILSQHISL